MPGGLADNRIEKLLAPCRVNHGKRFRLKDHAPDDTGKLDEVTKSGSKELLAHAVERLSELQEKLFAQDRWAMLILFQAMDAAGKDSTIKHVMSGVNPQGCQVTSFKAPTAEDLDHDYLWRCVRHLPERGRIGIFNRSYYEETLIVRVHPEILHKQKLPATLIDDDIWARRHRDISAFEQHLTGNGTAVVKIFLNLSKAEQKRRFLTRLDDPDKHWKFSADDVRERAHWNDYMHAYEETIRHTASPEAPWYVVPADNKWFARLVVVHAIIDKLSKLGVAYPKPDPNLRESLDAAREMLERE